MIIFEEKYIMENWKNIRSYEGRYQVSDLGNVKSLYQEYYGGWRKQQLMVRPEVLLALSENSDGYPQVTLYLNGIGKKLKVHRIVAETFILNPEDKPQINHINGIRNDNRVENLEWCTCKENIIHGIKVLGSKRACGIKQHLAKLTDSLVKEIKIEFSNGLTPYDLAPKYGVNVRTLYRIKNNETWKHVII